MRKIPASSFKLLSEARGAIAIQVAVALPVLIGFTALGIEMTTLFVHQKRMQSAADAAVVAAGSTGLTTAQSLAAARAVAGTNGFVNGTNGTVVTLNTPPTSGTNISTQSAREVVISKPYPLYLAKLFADSPITVRTRSVAIPGRQSVGCVLALSPSLSGAITINNNASVANSNCEIVANSTSSSALVMLNNTTITGPVYLAGGTSLSASAQITGRPLITNGSPLADPYGGVSLPSAPTVCSTQTNSAGDLVSPTAALNPGRFCNGLVIPTNRTVTLNPGVYFIDGKFEFKNNSALTGTSGVTIILNSTPNFTVGNGVVLTLTAPTTGTTAGLAFVARPTLSGTVSVQNGAALIVEGAIYLPSMDITFSGNSRTSGAQCTQLIARRIIVTTSLSFQANCVASNIKAIGRSQPILAE
jgi:Flp pilus assembly protein TadG